MKSHPLPIMQRLLGLLMCKHTVPFDTLWSTTDCSTLSGSTRVTTIRVHVTFISQPSRSCTKHPTHSYWDHEYPGAKLSTLTSKVKLHQAMRNSDRQSDAHRTPQSNQLHSPFEPSRWPFQLEACPFGAHLVTTHNRAPRELCEAQGDL